MTKIEHSCSNINVFIKHVGENDKIRGDNLCHKADIRTIQSQPSLNCSITFSTRKIMQ